MIIMTGLGLLQSHPHLSVCCCCPCLLALSPRVFRKASVPIDIATGREATGVGTVRRPYGKPRPMALTFVCPRTVAPCSCNRRALILTACLSWRQLVGATQQRWGRREGLEWGGISCCGVGVTLWGEFRARAEVRPDRGGPVLHKD